MKEKKRGFLYPLLIALVVVFGIYLVGQWFISYKERHRLTESTLSGGLTWEKGLFFDYKNNYLPPNYKQEEEQPSENQAGDCFVSIAQADSGNPQTEQNKETKIKEFEGDNVAKGQPVVALTALIAPDERSARRLRYWHERYSVNREEYPRNLTDNNRKTKAYPASWAFDYIVDLENVYQIEGVNLVWNEFGAKGKYKYITSWQLHGQEKLHGDKELSDNDWFLLGSDGVPGEPVTPVKVNRKIRRLRIRAESVDPQKKGFGEWIGIYELEAIEGRVD